MGPAVRAWRLAGVATGAVVVLDQATKQAVVATMDRGSETSIFFGIDLTYVRNKGVAFGAFGGSSSLVTALTLGAVALLAIYFALNTAKPYLWLPFGAVAGGALGNLADRARDGSVVDFIDLQWWPLFNVADIGVSCGAVLLILLSLRQDADEKSEKDPVTT